MFEEEITAPVPAAVAEARVMNRLKLGGLNDESRASFEEGSAVLEQAGFAGLSKQIAVETIGPYARGRTIVIPIRWSVPGLLGPILPTLDGNIELSPGADDGTTRVVLIGSYRPPFGEFGEAIDRALLRRVALATVRNFLSRITAAINPPHPHADPISGIPQPAED